MKFFKNYLAILAFLIVSAHLDASSTLITIISKKIAADEKRRVSDFSGISSSGSYNVFITMGNTESLRLEGDAEQISEIETVVEDGTLKIRNKKRTGSWNRNWNGKVTIANKALEAAMSGSGNIRYSGNADVKSIKSGSGRITKL